MIDQQQYIRVARTLPVLQQAEPELAREIRELGYLAMIPAGRDLFHPGDPVDQIPLLISGLVRVYQIGETGREVTLYRFRPGESCLLTANSILSAQLYPAIATVEEDAEALMVPAADFSRWVRDYDVWRAFVFEIVSQRLASLMTIVDEVAFRRLDVRVAALLLDRGRLQNPVPITHQEIADELGSAREVISRVLDDLSGAGLLKTERGRIEITDLEGLQARANA